VATCLARPLLVALAIGLAACAAPERRSETSAGLLRQEAREETLARMDHWSLVGRIAVTDGKDGGSGRIEWLQRGDSFRIDVRAPVTRQTWRLSGGPESAVLEGLEGGARHGSDAAELLRREVGWTLPVADLIAWARGARGTGPAVIEFDAEGRPERIEQHDWLVEYRAWHEENPALPRKVFASTGNRRVRLIVERWDVVDPS
jgi:outer membrane lipoprotein LolB